MTTTTPPSRPSPADMPGAREAARKLIAPGTKPPEKPFRPLYERGILYRSGMLAHPRLVALVLLSHSDPQTGFISASRQPHLSGLVAECGLHPGQVVVALNILRTRGWVTKTGDDSYYSAPLQPVIPGPIMTRLLRE